MCLLCFGQTILTLSLQDLHTNFMGMLLKCLQSASQPFLNSVVIQNCTDRFKIPVAEHYCCITTAYFYMLYTWFLQTDGKC